MGKPLSRNKTRSRAPEWPFETRTLRGVPVETESEKERAERLKADFIAKRGVTKVPEAERCMDRCGKMVSRLPNDGTWRKPTRTGS